MIFTTGYDWLDWAYFIAVTAGSALFIFKPWKEKTKEEIKAGKKIVRGYTSKSGNRGYVTKAQQDFEGKCWLLSFLLTFFLIILPWLLEALNFL